MQLSTSGLDIALTPLGVDVVPMTGGGEENVQPVVPLSQFWITVDMTHMPLA
jgi:hypothetical protein